MKTSHKSQVTSHKLFLVLSSVFCLLSSVYNAEAAPVVSSEELLNEPDKYDGKTVTYQGEVIGDIMLRGEDAWVNVRDKGAAIGVFCSKQLVEGIKHQGSYGFQGDIISLTGVFNRSCPQHGGDTDIHSEKIVIIREGGKISHPIEPQKVKAGIFLPVLAFVLAIAHLLIRKFR
jgi:hypothetical protein